jgi:hypothetical protein
MAFKVSKPVSPLIVGSSVKKSVLPFTLLNKTFTSSTFLNLSIAVHLSFQTSLISAGSFKEESISFNLFFQS